MGLLPHSFPPGEPASPILLTHKLSPAPSLAGLFLEPLKLRRSTIAIVGGLALVGGIAMAMTEGLEVGIGLVAAGGLLLITLVM